MSNYRVTIRNTLYYTYDVEAESEYEAKSKAIQEWAYDEVWAYSDDDGGHIDRIEFLD